MRLRRKRILSVLRPGEVAPTMTCFPLMGVGDFVAPPDLTGEHVVRHASSSGMHVRGPVANSAYVPDDIINPHPRFGALTKNIRVRGCEGEVLYMLMPRSNVFFCVELEEGREELCVRVQFALRLSPCFFYFYYPWSTT